ncbi:hypothetical protein CCR75_001169 [Bremia lactucae]|uniref:Uncharacterized protein n=1 Tax=Bremia lactucae TaxID=4779 RepID=A0A976FQ98_BRELC|nr:hypothetical protein CCR75_001169 [Bremia lactucae]
MEPRPALALFPKRQREDIMSLFTAPSPQSCEQLPQFLPSHELKFGLAPVARDKATSHITLVLCRFCLHFGRNRQPNTQHGFNQTIQFFRSVCWTNQYVQHHRMNHSKIWKRYERCFDHEKEHFFPVSNIAANKALIVQEIQLLPNELWAFGDSQDKTQLDLNPAIIKLVAMLPIDHNMTPMLQHTSLTPRKEHDTQEGMHTTRWVPSEGTFQSCTLILDSKNSFYQVVVHSRSELDCIVELLATGLSFEQLPSVIQSYQFHSSILFQNNNIPVKNVPIIALHRKPNTFFKYTKEQTVEFVRLLLAESLTIISRLLHGSWAFSLEFQRRMEHAPVRSYLSFRVNVYCQGAMHNIYLFSIPAFETTCVLNMFQTIQHVLDAVLPSWKQRLLGVRIDSVLPACGVALVTRLQNETTLSISYRSSQSCCQLYCIVTNFFSSLQGGCFQMILYEVLATIRSMPDLITKIPVPPPLNSKTLPRKWNNTSTKTWMALGNELHWIARHRTIIRQYLSIAKPSSLPDNSWWLFFSVFQYVVRRSNETVQQLLRKQSTVADQSQAMNDLLMACMKAFHALGPFINPNASPINHSIYLSRNRTFGVTKSSLLAFIRQVDPETIEILETTDAWIVDLAMENLALCGVNFLEALFEQQLAMESQVEVVFPTDVGFPTLPHELIQLCHEDFTSLVATYGPRVDRDVLLQEFQDLQRAAVNDVTFHAALATCNAETLFETAWAFTQGRFQRLEWFAGGFASVYTCSPIATEGSTGDLAFGQNQMPTSSIELLCDFRMEGSLHAQQLFALRTLHERLSKV